jgi:uncharacterized protein (TIGR02271 family)
LRLSNGREFLVPPRFFEEQADGTARLKLAGEELGRFLAPGGVVGATGGGFDARSTVESASRSDVGVAAHGGETVLPAIAEKLEVGKETVDAGGIRVHKQVSTETATVDEPLLRERIDIERVPVNRVLDGDVKIRQEGDTLIVPLAEEVLVVEKRVFVREEVRITRRREQVREPQQVPVRREDVVVERTEPRKHQ